jgi:hypothetical protein
MPNPAPPELIELAEQYRGKLPADFFEGLPALEADLARGQWPQEPLPRGEPGKKKGKKALKPGVRAAVLEELRRLLCTDDGRYKEVRDQGHSLTKVGIVAVAGYVAAALSIPVALATGTVAFITLAVLQVGVGAFCRLHPPSEPAADKKGQDPGGKSQTSTVTS